MEWQGLYEASQHISTYGNTLFPYVCAYQDLTFSLASVAADPPFLVAPLLLCAHHTCYAIHLKGRISWTDYACVALQLEWGCWISGYNKQFSDTPPQAGQQLSKSNYELFDHSFISPDKVFLSQCCCSTCKNSQQDCSLLGQRTWSLETQAPFFARAQVCYKHVHYSLWP